jgi:hypothetical protein
MGEYSCVFVFVYVLCDSKKRIMHVLSIVSDWRLLVIC